MKKLAGFLFPVIVGAVLLTATLAGLLLKPAQAGGELGRAAQQSSRRLLTVLPSAVRTATATSGDILNTGENLNARGAYLFLNVTGVLTTPLITLSVQAADPAAGTYRTVFAATAGVSATKTYLIYPGIGSAGNDVTQILSYPLPPDWRVVVAHDDTDPITYSVSAVLLP